ncbi:MAG: hypothetical protein KF788_17295 [Piscinibacter sp.]|nr:hypothetical protein [Piscinibacter sp.]
MKRRPLATCRALLVLLLALVHAGTPAAPADAAALPSLAELEAMGARIGEIRIDAQDVFDTTDPKEDRWLFRLADRLHIRTRPGVIERALLFHSGEPLSVRVIDETERLLRSNHTLYDVQIRPVAWHDGVVDLEVATRDAWSLDPGFSAGRSGGANTGGLHIREYNLLGTGVSLGIGHSKGIDRSSNEFQLSADRVFGTWASINLSHASNSDGQRDAASVVRPFYALDARWAAGASASKDDRLDSVYDGGEMIAQYRHRQTQAEVFGGWSPGLVDGWTHRFSLGVALQDDAYAPEPGLTAPAELPPDQRLVTPFARYELLEDRFEKELNRNLIGRPEFFSLGLASTLQLGRASRSLGSSTDAWVYAASIARGFRPAGEQTLIAAARLSGQYSSGQVRRQQFGLQTQYYVPQGGRWLFYAAGAADLLTRPAPAETLQLGGDNGLRGYPLRYQNGTHRALFTVEERFYTDLYVWRLFRVGGAVFADVGRAWGGGTGNLRNPGWLSDAGVGLRIVNTRTAFSNVLHVDLAFPVDADADVRKVQLQVKTRTSF